MTARRILTSDARYTHMQIAPRMVQQLCMLYRERTRWHLRDLSHRSNPRRYEEMMAADLRAGMGVAEPWARDGAMHRRPGGAPAPWSCTRAMVAKHEAARAETASQGAAPNPLRSAPTSPMSPPTSPPPRSNKVSRRRSCRKWRNRPHGAPPLWVFAGSGSGSSQLRSGRSRAVGVPGALPQSALALPKSTLSDMAQVGVDLVDVCI